MKHGIKENKPWVEIITHKNIAGPILQMIDPNHGIGWDHTTKPRFQYYVYHGQLLRRSLPGSAYGEKWTLRDGEEDPAEWTPVTFSQMPPLYSDIAKFFASFFDHEPAPDDWKIKISCTPHSEWDNLQTGTCPDCGGTWVWAEAGSVPGSRVCMQCGSQFNAQPIESGKGLIQRERYHDYTGEVSYRIKPHF